MTGLLRSPLRARLASLLATGGVAIAVWGGWPGARAAEAPLTRAVDIKSLGNQQAEAGLPVQLEGVVTAFKPMLFVVQDETSAVYVDQDGLEGPVGVGQRVRIIGHTGRGGFAPIVLKPSVTVLGPGTLPAPQPLAWNHRLTGGDDNRWVEVRGIVRSATNIYEQLLLQVAGRDAHFAVWCQILPGEQEPEPLVDAEIRLEGVYQVVFNQEGQLTGFQLQVPGLQYLHIERPPRDDPSALPRRLIGSLLRFDPEADSGHRVQLQGRVIYHQPGEALYLRDESAALLVETTAGGQLEPGDLVSVFGFPNAGGYPPMLEDATFSRVAPGPPPQPIEVGAGELQAPKHNFALVRLEATLVNIARHPAGQRLTLQAGTTLFEATHAGAAGSLANLREGSLLGISGICLVDFDKALSPRSFSLLMRTPADVTVIRPPPWWTLGKLLVLVGVLGGLSALTMAWVASLRTRVSAQTAELQKRLLREMELEAKYRTLVEGSPVGIWQTSAAGGTVYVNQAMCALLGLEDGRGTNPVVWGDFFPCRPEPPASTLASFETEVTGRDGVRRQLMVSSAPLPGARGELRGAIHSCIDISEQKRAAEATTVAREAAETANRAKSDFLAVMSHEMRTPLNAILGMTNLLLESPLDRRQRELARTSVQSGEALLELINDILDLSKIESGEQLQLKEGAFDLRVLVEDVMRLLRARADAGGIVLAAEISPQLPGCLRFDHGRLRQVLVNLVGNAIKFTDHGSVTVRVHCAEPTTPHVDLRIEVVDTGIGIAPADQERLFQPFTQADSSSSRRRCGTGLGLAISRRILERMGGRIGVESDPGRGSLFWCELRLPVAAREGTEASAVGKPAPVPPADPPAFPAAPDRALRVLVAEDNETNRRLVQFMLEGLGLQPDFAGNGVETVGSWERTGYDVILMDCQMPEMDGLQATQEIRRRELARGIAPERRVRVVALTANALKGDRERCLAAGMDDYLTKPFTAAQLARVLSGIAAATPSPTLPGTTGDELLNAGRLDQLRQALDIAEVQSLVEEFLKELPDHIEEMARLAAAGQWKELERQAHSLKGSGGSLGFETCADKARVLEAAAAQQDRARAGQTLEELRSLRPRFAAAFARWVSDTPACATRNP